MALGANDVQTAEFDYQFVIFLAVTLDLAEDFLFLFLGHVGEILADGLFLLLAFILVARGHLTDIIDLFGMFAQHLGEVFGGIATEQNVGAATGHVGGNGDGPAATGLCYDMRLAFVVLGVQYVMRNALTLQQAGEVLRDFDRGGADQHRLAFGVARLDLLDNGLEFSLLCAVDQVGQVLSNHLLVGRSDHYIHLIDLMQLFGLGQRGTGHTGQLLIEAKVVLEGDGGQRVVLALYLDALFGLDGLVQTFAIAPTNHLTACELIDDNNLAIFDNIVLVALEKNLGLDGVFHVARQVDVGLIIDVLHTGQAFDLFDAALGQHNGAQFLIDGIVGFRLERSGPACELDVHIGRFLALAGDNQRRACLVDQNIVYLVNDGIVKAALHHLVKRRDHVVAQVVEAELVIGAVGDVGLIGSAARG